MYAPNTPEEYEPLFFCKANRDDMLWFVDAPQTKTAGSVSTPYHQVGVTVHAAKDGWKKEGGSTNAASELQEVGTGAVNDLKKTPALSKVTQQHETEIVPKAAVGAAAVASDIHKKAGEVRACRKTSKAAVSISL